MVCFWSTGGEFKDAGLKAAATKSSCNSLIQPGWRAGSVSQGSEPLLRLGTYFVRTSGLGIDLGRALAFELIDFFLMRRGVSRKR